MVIRLIKTCLFPYPISIGYDLLGKIGFFIESEDSSELEVILEEM